MISFYFFPLYCINTLVLLWLYYLEILELINNWSVHPFFCLFPFTLATYCVLERTLLIFCDCMFLRSCFAHADLIWNTFKPLFCCSVASQHSLLDSSSGNLWCFPLLVLVLKSDPVCKLGFLVSSFLLASDQPTRVAFSSSAMTSLAGRMEQSIQW